MPAAVPVVAAVAGSAVSSAVGGWVLGSSLFQGLTVFQVGIASKLIGGAAGFIVSSGLKSLGGKKSKSASLSDDARSNVSTQRSSVGTHKIIYGQTRASGVVVFDGATQSGPNSASQTVSGVDKFRHFVIVLAGHEVEEISTIYIEDKPVSLDGNGFVTDAPYIRSNTSESQVSASLTDVTSAHVFTTGSAHTLTSGETVYIPVEGGGGRRTYSGYEIASTPTATTFTLSSGPQISTILLNDADYPVYVKRSTDSSLKFIRVRKFLGSTDQTASPDLVNEINAWTENHRLRGLAYIYIRIEQAPEFALNIQSISALVKGKKVFDPRTDTTAWSANAALCIRDYMASDYGFDCDDDELNDTYFEAAANICDENVTLQDSSTQDRYTCHGVLDTATAPLDNLSTLLTSLVGVVTYVQGQFRLHAGAYDSPSGTITTDMLAGPASIQVRTPRKDLFNAVRGVYVAPDKNYLPTDFPILTNSTYEAQDGGQQIVRDIDLPFTQHAEAAQRIAKIILEKARQGIILEVPLNHSALKYSVYDTVYVTNTQLGWTNKIFRITRIALATPGPFTFTLQEESSASYDWNNGEATVTDPAPDTDLPDPFIVVEPGVPSVTEELYETRGSAGVKALAIATWASSPDPYARWYVLEYRRVENIDWIVLPPTGALTANIDDIAPGRYEFRVKAINHLGAASGYAQGEPLEIYGLSARPSDITGVSLQALWGIAHLRWDLPVDLDVRIGGRILIRHSEATSGATWEDSTSIGNETIAGNANGVHLPLKAGTYLLKAEDSSGLTSVNATTITTKGLSLLAFSSVATINEDPDFAGTHSGTYTAAGTLRLGGALLFDDIADFDAITDLDLAGGVASAGTYSFDDDIDLGSVQTVRLQSVIEITTVNTLDNFDARQGFIDDWLDFDGSQGGGSGDCYIEMRETDDDPSGTPTWTPWQRLDVADREARAFQFRSQLTSNDPAYNVHVSTLGVTISELA